MHEIAVVIDEIAGLIWDLVVIGFGVIVLQLFWKVAIEVGSESKK